MSDSLIIRKKADGSTVLEGELPDDHVFSARWLARELGELVRVQITVVTSDGEAEYDFVGFEELDDVDADGAPKPNFTGWRAIRRRSPRKRGK